MNWLDALGAPNAKPAKQGKVRGMDYLLIYLVAATAISTMRAGYESTAKQDKDEAVSDIVRAFFLGWLIFPIWGLSYLGIKIKTAFETTTQKGTQDERD